MTSEIFARSKRRKILKVWWGVCTLLAVPFTLYASSPASEQSERMGLSPQSLLLDIAVLDTGIVVVGERGHILISSDGGGSWRQIIAPTRAALTNVYFADERHGWASGHSGVVLSTSDGGDSWKLVSEPDPEISYFDSLFFDERNGFLVGAYGEFSKTDDAATSLENIRIDEEELHFYSLEQSPNGTLFLVGENGQIFRSSDKARTWRKLNSPYEGSLFGILCLDDETLLTFGLRGHLFRSADAGNTWTQVEIGSEAMLTAGIRLSSNKLVISSVSDLVFMSSDEGHTFYEVAQLGIDGTVALAEAANDQTVVFCGRHGVTSVETSVLETAFQKAQSADE